MKRFLIPEIEASALSVTGPVREDNQDAILLPSDSLPALPGRLYAVADGMGGYAHGGVASTLTLETLHTTLRAVAGDAPTKAMRQGVEAANLDVFKTAQSLGAGRMGSTITAAYVVSDTLHLAHVGDSRAYLIRNNKAACLTNDHTVVGDMVRARLISPEKVHTHAQRSILTKAVGLGMFIQPDISQMKLQAGDRLVLCCDGVWSVLQDNDFARLSGENLTPQALSEALIGLSIERATDDNCSVVVAQLHGFTEMSTPAELAPERRNGHGLAGWVHKIINRNGGAANSFTSHSPEASR